MDEGESGTMRKRNEDVSLTVSDRYKQSRGPEGRRDGESNPCRRLSKGRKQGERRFAHAAKPKLQVKARSSIIHALLQTWWKNIETMIRGY